MRQINLITHPQSCLCKIFITNKQIEKISQKINQLKLGNFAIVVTDKKIYQLQQANIKKLLKGIRHKIVFLPQGEKAKTEKYLFFVLKQILSIAKLGKKILIISIGGGSISDLTGLAAALYKRGINCIHIPTTLLAQIDAAIGGKTAIDYLKVKNIIGTFYQPQAIFIDPIFLETLPLKQFKQGIAEIIKYSMIVKSPLYTILNSLDLKQLYNNHKKLKQIIEECVKIKTYIVSTDEKETKGLRTLLNFGHTIGHALELNQQNTSYLHGECIALGMIVACRLSKNLNLACATIEDKLINLLEKYSLPTKIKINDFPSFIKSLTYDKKFIHGKIRMVLLKRVGESKVVDNIPLNLLKKSLIAILA